MPFLKWAGGKGQLLTQLDRLLPDGLEDVIPPCVPIIPILLILHTKSL